MGLLPSLTRHQREILRDLKAESHHYLDGWVPGRDIGARAALEHLFEKGYVERKIEYGPRGGAYKVYRPKS